MSKQRKTLVFMLKLKITETVGRLHSNDHGCRWKFLRQAVVHARDRVPLRYLPSNAKPVLPVFRQVSRFQNRTRSLTGSSLHNAMPSSGQEGPAGGIKPSLHQSFVPPFFLPPPRSLALSRFLSPSLSLSIHRRVPCLLLHLRRCQTQVSMTWPFFFYWRLSCATF